MSSSGNCPFCSLGARVVGENDLAAAVRDKEPASRGHTLVVPKRHCPSFFDLTPAEVEACYSLLREERQTLLRELHPDGFNVGVNDGAAAGQSIEHTYWHLIPRYRGDHPDPRGGVRHVIPTRR
ncbi:MAG: HIT family protein [Deltaproteobacteria bacterium]|nr:HIT family protein [Deltaproteobacteria bacterium]